MMSIRNAGLSANRASISASECVMQPGCRYTSVPSSADATTSHDAAPLHWGTTPNRADAHVRADAGSLDMVVMVSSFSATSATGYACRVEDPNVRGSPSGGGMDGARDRT